MNIGSTAKGDFTIDMKACDANVASIDIKFTGSWKKFVYNLLRPLLKKKMGGLMNSELCKILRKEVDVTARKELETFPVVVKIDKWSEIDYRLTSQPVYTSDYMDVFSNSRDRC